MVVLSSGLDGRRRGFQVEFLPRVEKETFLPIFPTIRQILAKRYSSAKFALIPGKYQWLDNIYGWWIENYFSHFFPDEVKSFYSQREAKEYNKICWESIVNISDSKFSI